MSAFEHAPGASDAAAGSASGDDAATRPISEPADRVEVSLRVNGEQVRRTVPVRLLLVDFLRDELELTGTHAGCEHGICGACTVLIDGEPARSCITFAAQLEGCEVTTVEGLTPPDGLNPMQAAFKAEHGLQCGFCTPGFIVTLSAADPAEHPDDDSIRELLSGNLCRCTGYEHIVRAVRTAWGRDGGDAAAPGHNEGADGGDHQRLHDQPSA